MYNMLPAVGKQQNGEPKTHPALSPWAYMSHKKNNKYTHAHSRINKSRKILELTTPSWLFSVRFFFVVWFGFVPQITS